MLSPDSSLSIENRKNLEKLLYALLLRKKHEEQIHHEHAYDMEKQSSASLDNINLDRKDVVASNIGCKGGHHLTSLDLENIPRRRIDSWSSSRSSLNHSSIYSSTGRPDSMNSLAEGGKHAHSVSCSHEALERSNGNIASNGEYVGGSATNSQPLFNAVDR